MRERIKKGGLVNPDSYKNIGKARPAKMFIRPSADTAAKEKTATAKPVKTYEMNLSQNEKFRQLDIKLFGCPFEEAIQRTREGK